MAVARLAGGRSVHRARSTKHSRSRLTDTSAPVFLTVITGADRRAVGAPVSVPDDGWSRRASSANLIGKEIQLSAEATIEERAASIK